ncbi:carbohydrate kinase family protein [Haladaptatus sp. CMSO5]|uniref:carbohydrate kinase family protein n=1 Tax=Haladaptatus sp. CMSO5 TaxID=3120514 RepID=UPI002FCE1CA1
MVAPEILIAGETLIDFIPDRPGPLGTVESFSRRAGGAPANVAIALSRLDETPYFLTNLSTDPFGEFLAQTLTKNGVPEQFVTRDEERKTTLAFVSHDADADRSFSFYRENTADTVLHEGCVPDDVLAAVSWVYVGGVLLSKEPARSATFALVERAREHGCSIALDPNYRPELWERDEEFAATIERVVSLADVVNASIEDFAVTEFADENPERLAENLLEAGPHTVFLTLGDAGSHVVASADAPWGTTQETHPGFPVEPTDTTGAGDAFVAGVLAQIASGNQSPTEALAFANAVAAVTTTAPGAITSLPTRSEVRTFRGRHA